MVIRNTGRTIRPVLAEVGAEEFQGVWKRHPVSTDVENYSTLRSEFGRQEFSYSGVAAS